MTNLFKTRYLPNPDGTESTTALTNANTVFIHTYLGDDSTGDGTREKPYRSMTKALLKASTTYVLFRGLLNESFNVGTKNLIGDDINQVLIASNYTVTLTTTIRITFDDKKTGFGGYPTYANCIYEKCSSHGSPAKSLQFELAKTNYVLVASQAYGGFDGMLNCTVSNSFLGSFAAGTTYHRNSIFLKTLQFTFTTLIRQSLKYAVLNQSTIPVSTAGVRGIVPSLTNDSIANVQMIRNAFLLLDTSITEANMNSWFNIDGFGNETCKVIKEQHFGGSHPNIFNKYAPNLTGKLNTAVTTGAKTSVTINIADANQWPTTGDLFMPTETAYTANGVTMPIGSFEVWSYTSITIVSPERITLSGPSYTFKTAHSDLNKNCTLYGDVLDYTLNPDPYNEALWASDIGGYVGCFRPAHACDVETGLSAISNVDETGTDSGSGDLLQIVNGELKFNSASSQLWNRLSDTTTISIPNGSNFKGLNAMSQDGSPFGYYIGKKQTLISPTAIAAGNALTVGKWYKVYNHDGNSVSEAIIYNGVQYLPEYTFLCVTGVTTFSELELGSGSYVKEILSGVLESIEILPYNDMTTPSTFPKFSAPLMGECKLIFYTASGAARYSKTTGDPVKFTDLDLANMITDFGTVKNKISYYNDWAVSNADSEFYLLTNSGLSATLRGYFTQSIPTIKYLRREINGHFDMPYDY